MTLDDPLQRWQDLARLASELQALDGFEARRQCIAETAKRFFRMDRAFVYLIGRRMDELSAPGRNQLPFFEYLALQRRPILVQDAASEHGFELPEVIADWRFPTLLFIPLIVRETALGILSLASSQLRDFSPEDEVFIGALMPQLTAALDAELLLRTTQRQATRQAFLAELDEVILLPKLPEILAATNQLLQRELHVERTLIFSDQHGADAHVLDVAVAEGCPYANGGCLKDHACGRLANSMIAARTVETFNAEAIAVGVQASHDQCQERQLAVAPILTHRNHYGLLMAFNKRDGSDFTLEELELLDKVARKLGLALDNQALFEQLNNATLETITGFARALDSKDQYTANHSENVAQYGYLTAMAMGMGSEECQRLKLAGFLHDIGKIGIPDEVLNKPGKLTDEEFQIIKSHPGQGYRILEPFKQMRDVADAACSHHERFDGSGYPKRLRGKDIPVGGRILALADAFDTLTSDRKYRPRVPMMEALVEMRRCAGSHFDPDVVIAFFHAMAEMGPQDLNRNTLPPRELLLEMADLTLPLERFKQPSS